MQCASLLAGPIFTFFSRKVEVNRGRRDLLVFLYFERAYLGGVGWGGGRVVRRGAPACPWEGDPRVDTLEGLAAIPEVWVGRGNWLPLRITWRDHRRAGLSRPISGYCTGIVL